MVGWRLLRDLSLALIAAAIVGVPVALLASLTLGLALAFVVGVAGLMVAVVWERRVSSQGPAPVRPRPGDLSPGQRLELDWELGEREGIFMGLAGPPGRPQVRVQLDDGNIVTVPMETVRPLKRRWWSRGQTRAWMG